MKLISLKVKAVKSCIKENTRTAFESIASDDTVRDAGYTGKQCFGSGSVSGSAFKFKFRRAKMTHKKRPEFSRF
jgi:hypothetical protein